MKKKPFLISILLISTILSYSQSWTWLEDQLSYAREGLSSAVLDDSIFYSGGRLFNNSFQNTVDIYDIGDNQWSSVDLTSSGRFISTMVSAGGKIFIAGGNNYPGTENFSDVDIFDKATGEWTIEDLSEDRSVYGGVVACGNKVFFAGGHYHTNGATATAYTDVIDIYDTETDTWSIDSLSVPRGFIGSVAVGNKVYFAGGAIGTHAVTDVIDIYDIETEEWTVEYLTEGRAFIAAVAYNDKIYFAGGCKQNSITSTLIEVYDVTTGQWGETMNLQSTRLVFGINVNNVLVFSGVCNYVTLSGVIGIGLANGVIEVYYPETGHWDYSIPNLDPARTLYSCASYKNKVYHAGGWTGQATINNLNILECVAPKIIHVPGDQPTIQAAIEVATHGDTILVDEGTYYENINFLGKAITVASQYIIDWDESHIENTIIDGSQATNPDMAATVLFISGEDTTSVIKGFTITGGSGILNATYNVMNGGGIAIENAGAKIEDNIITENNMEHLNGAGGCGIGAITLTGDTWLVVRNNEINNNSAIAHGISAFGGGIASTMNSIIHDNNIEYNECTNIDGSQADGGGIEIEQIPGSNPIFASISGNAIRYNILTVDNVATGAGIMIYQASANIHNNAISNNMVVANQFGNGAGIYVYENLGEIIIENNEISGNGIISESWARGGGIALWEPTNKVELTNNTIQQNHIEGMDNRGPGVWFRYPSGDISVTGNFFYENTGPMIDINSARGGGLCVLDASGEVIIDKNIFRDNQINDGGGLYLRNSLNTIVSNNFFKGNEAFVGGGMSYFNPTYKTAKDDLLEDLPLIVNNTLIYNIAESHGGGINYQCPFVFPILFNSIIRYNTANLGNDIYSYSSSEFGVSYCNVIEDDIFGEWTGDFNIETDPEVIDDFGHIAYTSQCIEAGTMELEVNGEIYSCPEHDIDGQIRPLNATPDIGADEVLISRINSQINDEDNSLLKISPNPSSGLANIQFTISEQACLPDRQGFVICDLYKISGVRVKQLVNAEMSPGSYEKAIDLSDLPKGVYFITLKTNKGIQSTKLIKL